MISLIEPIDYKAAADLVERFHYLHRVPKISFAFGWVNYSNNQIIGVATFGSPASQHLQISACPSNPQLVIELNRVWVDDKMPPNSESWFLARVLKMMPPRIVVSYADTAAGHVGYMYRALNFNYAGWTDMDRKSPRFDYVTDGKHSRNTFREGAGLAAERVPRKPKVKYWTVTGNKREKKILKTLCGWPIMSWKDNPPPTEHKRLRAVNDYDRANRFNYIDDSKLS